VKVLSDSKMNYQARIGFLGRGGLY